MSCVCKIHIVSAFFFVSSMIFDNMNYCRDVSVFHRLLAVLHFVSFFSPRWSLFSFFLLLFTDKIELKANEATGCYNAAGGLNNNLELQHVLCGINRSNFPLQREADSHLFSLMLLRVCRRAPVEVLNNIDYIIHSNAVRKLAGIVAPRGRVRVSAIVLLRA